MMQNKDSAKHSNFIMHPIRWSSAWIWRLLCKFVETGFLYLLEGQKFGNRGGVRQIEIWHDIFIKQYIENKITSSNL